MRFLPVDDCYNTNSRTDDNISKQGISVQKASKLPDTKKLYHSSYLLAQNCLSVCYAAVTGRERRKGEGLSC